MTRLTLVRHGRPVVDPALPASSWQLDADAVAEVRALPEPVGSWFSSPEPKALATARELTGSDVTTVRDLREAERTAVWMDDPAQFHLVVRRAFADPGCAPVLGWEPLTMTRQRVVAAVRGLLAQTPGDVVLVGHGTAWTLLVADLTGNQPDLASWTHMRMPDLATLDISPDGPARLVRSWGGW